MAENISSNVLFHFTNSMGDLESILKHGFFPHYCPEYTLNPDDKRAAREHRHPARAGAMICFCDLPLSLIRKHRKKYGKFAIGLRKAWGMKHGVAPVLYTHSKAPTRQPMLRITNQAPESNDKTPVHDIDILAAYTKPFRGPTWRNEERKRTIKFYDEREWRYVPPAQKEKPLFIDWATYETVSKRRKLHSRFKAENALPISPDDIQYLIIPYDKEEKNIIHLHTYLAGLYNQKDVILVTTAIMTDDCLTQDV